jgi:hypothetical protein
MVHAYIAKPTSPLCYHHVYQGPNMSIAGLASGVQWLEPADIACQCDKERTMR